MRVGELEQIALSLALDSAIRQIHSSSNSKTHHADQRVGR